MQELIAKLLPEICVSGVPGVPDVPDTGNPQIERHHPVPDTGTHAHSSRVPGVLSAVAEHIEHGAQNTVFQRKDKKIKAGTLGTPGTPDFDDSTLVKTREEIIRKFFADYEHNYEIPW